jgi:hypothetical protein
MEKRRLVIAFVVAAGLLCSVSFAGGPLGPPKAFVGHGKWLVDVEYAHEQIDLKACGKTTSGYEESPGVWVWNSDNTRFKVEDMRLNMFFGSLAYGLCENWDVFARVGAADATDEVKPAIGDGYGEKWAYDGGYGFAWGVGTRATFCQCGPWIFGAVGQLTWFNPGSGEDTFAYDANDTMTAKFDASWHQFQLGIGATYQADGWWIYGGPCLLFVNGDLDVDAVETITGEGTSTSVAKGTLDLMEKSEFGGWFGVGCNLPQNAKCYAEAQIYGDGWAIAGGVLFPLAVQ